MKTIRQFASAYEGLEAGERSRLMLQAAVRRDQDDLQRLCRTAPKETWHVPNFYFANLHLFTLTLGVAMELLEASAALWRFEAVASDPDLDDQAAQRIEKALAAVAYALLAKWQGWERFAAEKLGCGGKELLEGSTGFEAITSAVAFAERVAFSFAEVSAWLGSGDATGKPAEPITAQQVAERLREEYGEGYFGSGGDD